MHIDLDYGLQSSNLVDMMRLKQFGIVLILLFPVLVIGNTIDQGSVFDPSWVSILPPIVAIILALITRQAHLALFVGIWLGSVILNGGVISGLTKTLDTYIVESITDKGHASILVFTLAFGGLIGVISANGGMKGMVKMAARYATSNKNGQLATMAMGFVIFFDDYANTLLVGNMMRPFTDTVRISREKLSYLVDSTAAPVSSLAVISTWSIFQMSLLDGPFSQFGITENPYFTFLKSIPYSFYCILTLVFMFMNILLAREFGPMLVAEKRARRTGKVLAPGAQPLSDPTIMAEGSKTGTTHWSNALVPVFLVIVVTGIGLYFTGKGALGPGSHSLREIIGEADPYATIIWSACIAGMVAILMTVTKNILSLNGAMEAWINGVRSMVMACVILVLAWTIGRICEDMRTAQFLVSISAEILSPSFLPLVTFLTAAAISFSTGSSWATMSILVPVVVPMAIQLMNMEANAIVDTPIFLSTFSAILSGSVFGDHCSPISDTTILSSTASCADHIDHVRTQMPYAVTVAIITMLVGYIGIGFDLSLSVILLVSIALLAALCRFYGRPVSD